MTLLKPRNLLLLLALLVAGGLATVVSLRYRPPVKVAEVVKTLPGGVDVALQEIDYTHSEGGVARWRLTARQVERRQEDRQTVIDAPHLVFFDEGGTQQGTLTAHSGRLAADFSAVELQGAVEIVSVSGYTIRTEQLTYRQEDRTIRTEMPVALSSDRMSLDGVGMTLDLDSRRLKVLGKIRAVLAPAQVKREKI